MSSSRSSIGAGSMRRTRRPRWQAAPGLRSLPLPARDKAPALEHVPFLRNRDMLYIFSLAHVLVGEPVPTSPGHALIRKSVKSCRVDGENAPSRLRVRRPRLKEIEQVAGIGHLVLHARMRPIGPPHQPVRVGAHQRLMEGPRVGIIRRLVAEPVRARKLDPAAAVTD